MNATVAKKTLNVLFIISIYYMQKLNIIKRAAVARILKATVKNDGVLDVIRSLEYRIRQYISIIRGMLNITNSCDVIMMDPCDLHSHSYRYRLEYNMPDKQRLLMYFMDGVLSEKKMNNSMICEVIKLL